MMMIVFPRLFILGVHAVKNAETIAPPSAHSARAATRKCGLNVAVVRPSRELRVIVLPLEATTKHLAPLGRERTYHFVLKSCGTSSHIHSGMVKPDEDGKDDDVVACVETSTNAPSR
eukprot:CAMPEP_0179607060 /NCGR_PEP_ID=MMETSP0930-20121108/1743_1 /TAXON_ID=548131 ORGANISM="Ostreococcus mediterraneus, Strain clade-D-RCC1621" /NCGR_SAMPLE_ID=MMETSP0930 /ASSEMBLY_ACC=CAM_ASM_000580 /LENGTH=116 /DNA_ID=CAMNT_0021475511 /DNA_START=285 /DNA_END=632 /DNA_ORIENTATION=-